MTPTLKLNMTCSIKWITSFIKTWSKNALSTLKKVNDIEKFSLSLHPFLYLSFLCEWKGLWKNDYYQNRHQPSGLSAKMINSSSHEKSKNKQAESLVWKAIEREKRHHKWENNRKKEEKAFARMLRMYHTDIIHTTIHRTLNWFFPLSFSFDNTCVVKKVKWAFCVKNIRWFVKKLFFELLH